MSIGNAAKQSTGFRFLSDGAVFFFFLCLYGLTAQRGVSWQDSGIFQHRVLTGTFTDLSCGGLAVVHPWYLASARLFCLCFPEPWRLYAVNAFSGLGLAVALVLLSVLVRRLTGSKYAALAAVVTLGLAQMAWWLATVAEVYTWSLAFLFAELLCLLRVCEANSHLGRSVGWCVLLAVNGMHASLHNVAFLNLPAYAVLWLVQMRASVSRPGQAAGFACTCAACWLAGAALLVVMVVRDIGQSHSVVTTLKSLLVGTGYGATVLGTGGVNLRLALGNLALSAVSFASPCWAFAFFARKGCSCGRMFGRALLALTVIHALFWVRYFVPDQATFVLPTLGLGAVWLGIGAAAFRKKAVLAVLAAGVVCQVALPPLLAHVAGKRAARTRALPFRNEARYWLVPWKHNEHSAQQFAEAVDKQLGAGDVLIGDLTAVNPIVAARAVGDVSGAWRLVSGWSGETDEDAAAIVEQALFSKGRVFVVSPVVGYTQGSLLRDHDFEKAGVLWRVKKRK